MIGWWLAAAASGATRLAVTGPLRPGLATEIVVATVEGGEPDEAAPKVRIEGGTLRAVAAVRPGVFRGVLVPDPGATSVRVWAGDAEATWPVAVPAPSSLVVPEQVEAASSERSVRFLVSAPEGVTAADLQLAASEGSILAVTDTPSGVEVVLGPEELPFPRFVVVGVRDARSDASPAWVRVRVRARPRIPLQAEPGASLSLTVGSREYGPFLASGSGNIDAWVDQYPGESVASATLVDDLGNQTRTDLPLVARLDPSLVGVVTGEILPGRTPPVVHLQGLDAHGQPARTVPSCRAPFGELAVVEEGPGRWMVPVPALEMPRDLRVACTLGPTRGDWKVPVATGVPATLSLRVWPEDLRADFPTSELRVSMEDHRGERLPVEQVEVDADLGAVAMEADGGIVLRGDYDGSAAVEAGEDEIRAVFRAPAGSGPPGELRFGWSAIPTRGAFQAWVRVLDVHRRPIVAAVELGAVGATVATTSGADGWAVATVQVPDADVPIELVARSAGQEQHRLVLPGEPASGGPGTPDLVATGAVSIRPGRASGLDIEVEPSILRAAPGAVAWIYVKLEDGAGQPITDEPVQLTASEGTIGELHTRADGTLVAEYTPLPVEVSRSVEIEASTSTMHSAARLTLEPRVVRFSLGPWIGATTTFGSTWRPTFGVDLDLRTRSRWAGEALMWRASVSASSFAHRAATGVGPDAELRSTVVPASLGVSFRADRGAWSTWAGVGGVVGLHHLEVRFGNEVVSRGDLPLFGPELHGAVARRLLGGEATLSVRAAWLPASDVEVGYTGNLGGITPAVGYRLVW